MHLGMGAFTITIGLPSPAQMFPKQVRSLVDGGSDAVSEGTVFSLLRNRRRRFALHHLKQRDEPVTASRLAEQVAAWETGTPVNEIDDSDHKRVHVSLLQSHLPAMVEAGVVEREGRSVQLTDGAADIDVYVGPMSRTDLPWEEYYLALCGLGGAFLALLWLRVYPLSGIGDRAWFTLLVGLFCISAVVHRLHQRRVRIGADGPPPERRGVA